MVDKKTSKPLRPEPSGSGRAKARKKPSRADEQQQAKKDDDPSGEVGEGLSQEEAEDVEERRHLRAVVVHEIIRAEGEAELRRSLAALWWSGLAAGLAIGFCFLGEAVLAHGLPKTDWSPMVANLGYPVGFLMVILSRHQLFTENTLTAVLPVIYRREWKWFWVMMRLWGVVLVANIVGCVLFAGFLAYTGMVSGKVESELLSIAEKMMSDSGGVMLAKGVVSGWLIASLVWMTPSSEGATEFFVIVVITYLLAAADCTHIVAGSVDAVYLLMLGRVGLGDVISSFFIPTLVGNVIGGTVLFAMLSYAQVHEEIEEEPEEGPDDQPAPARRNRSAN